MDYVAKASFIKWLGATPVACIVISHDRDVLGNVERIIEIKGKKAVSYKGGYKEYLAQNTSKASSQLQNYEVAVQTIAKLKDRIEYAKARAPSYVGKKNPWIVLRNRLERQLAKVEADNPKPSFWIDQESAENLSHKVVGSYHKYKDKNIKISQHSNNERTSELLKCENIQVGYDGLGLFRPISFNLSHGERLHVIGRNGVGKTTLIQAINDSYNQVASCTILEGQIILGRQVKLALYEQELSADLLGMSLITAIENIYKSAGLAVSTQTAMRLMGDYLFDPSIDADKQVGDLSGGQKARLQLIRMLAGKPNLLILDEPTNHLDLPSIEELESALISYQGAVLYVSHDSYFARNIGGKELRLQALDA
jgi:ATPase subunit of ABC transporter with duplicated ATPase domains